MMRHPGRAALVSLVAVSLGSGAAVAQLGVDPVSPWPGPPIKDNPTINALPPSPPIATHGFRLHNNAGANSSDIPRSVGFASASASLSRDARDTLDRLGNILLSPAFADARVLITGHADTVGDSAANLRLAERRARAAQDYLISQFKLDPKRIDIAASGTQEQPVQTPDQTPEPRNRSASITILWAQQPPNQPAPKP